MKHYLRYLESLLLCLLGDFFPIKGAPILWNRSPLCFLLSSFFFFAIYFSSENLKCKNLNDKPKRIKLIDNSTLIKKQTLLYTPIYSFTDLWSHFERTCQLKAHSSDISILYSTRIKRTLYGSNRIDHSFLS